MLRPYLKLADNPIDKNPPADGAPNNVDKPEVPQKPEAPAQKDVKKPGGKRELTVVERDAGQSKIGERNYIFISVPDLKRTEFAVLANTATIFLDTIIAKNNGKIPNWGRNNLGKKSVDAIFRREAPNSNVLVINIDLAILFKNIVAQLSQFNFDISPISKHIEQMQQQIEVAKQQPALVLMAQVVKEFKNSIYQKLVDTDIIGLKLIQSDNQNPPLASRRLFDGICDLNVTRSINLEPGSMRYDPAEGCYIFHLVDPSQIDKLAKDLQNNNIDSKQLVARLASYTENYKQKKDRPTDFRKVINATNVSSNTKMLMGIAFPSHIDLQEELISYLRFSFPVLSTDRQHDLSPRVDIPDFESRKKLNTPLGMWIQNEDTKIHYLYGSYDDMYKFGAMLKEQGWDISLYRDVFQELQYSRIMQPAYFNGNLRYPGALDGYEDYETKNLPDGRVIKVRKRDEKGNPAFRYEDFFDDLDLIVNPGKTHEQIEAEGGMRLYDKQKDGVRWLYERQGAILGDDPGTGKTLSTLTTAAMRAMEKDENGNFVTKGKVLIVTMNNLKYQWAAELQSKFGIDPKKIVICADEKNTENIPYIINSSLNPESIKDADWIIISYSNIGRRPQFEEDKKTIKRDNSGRLTFKGKDQKTKGIYHSLLGIKFTSVIIDESHNVKNPDAASSIVLEDVVKNIPFRYAASATTIANTAADIHNILKMTGHPLGKMDFKWFKKLYVGRKLKTKDVSDPDFEGQLDDMLARAFKLKQALILSGAYLSRSMRDIRETLPDHNILTKYLSADLFPELPQIEMQYELEKADGKRVLAAMIKSRVDIARAKVPQTVSFAKEILRDPSGHKVLIFSNFIPCVNAIAKQLDTFLRSAEYNQEMGYEYDEEFEKAYGGPRVLKISENDEGPIIQDKVNSFKMPDDPARVMVISAKKGGTGLSLENTAQFVIMNDFDWSPSTAKQTEGRAYRINNIAEVNTHYMVMQRPPEQPKTLDSIFFEYVRMKIEVSEQIQKLDSETQKLILGGLTGIKQQEELRKIQEEQKRKAREDLAAQEQLNIDLAEFAREHNLPEVILGENAAELLDALAENADALGKDAAELDIDDLAKIMGDLGDNLAANFDEDEKDEVKPEDEGKNKKASWYQKAKLAFFL